MTENEIIKALENYSLKTQALFEAINLIKRQREEIDALRWTNKHLIKTENEKRRELWQKAIREFAKKLREKKDIEFYRDAELGITFQYETVDIDDINNVEKEMIDYIKE